MTVSLIRRGNLVIDIYRGRPCEDTEKIVFYKPRERTSGETNPTEL